MSDAIYQPCPICKSPVNIVNISLGIDGRYLNCYRCGIFKLEQDAYFKIGDLRDEQIANISGWIYEYQKEVITTENLKMLKDLKIPIVGEKAIKLLKFIAKERPIPGQWIQIDFPSIYGLKSLDENTEYPKEVFEKLEKSLPYLSITWTIDENELRYIINDYLIEEQGYLTGEKRYKITPKGWAYLDSLKYRNVDSQMAFIAMSFDKSFNDLNKSIKKSILNTGYEPKRLDEIDHISLIDDKMIALIRQSKFIVADFTTQNNGVFFESGFAQGLNISVVRTCRKDELENLHFDTNHYNFLTWEEDKFSEFEEKLKNRILAVIGKGTYNPE